MTLFSSLPKVSVVLAPPLTFDIIYANDVNMVMLDYYVDDLQMGSERFDSFADAVNWTQTFIDGFRVSQEANNG